MFHRYIHIEKFGTEEVENIEFGKCFVFPKIDGTNGSIYLDKDENECYTIRCGSRNRVLSLENDNQGFMEYVLKEKKFSDFLTKHPNLRLFGEWLVPHSLKTYRNDTWRKFYVFDVCMERGEGFEYLPYEIYQPMMEEFCIDYIPPISIVTNGNYDAFIFELKKNDFLIEDGKGIGEGIVIKNYSFYNKYGRQTWAKIVTSEFKEKHRKAMGPDEREAKQMVETLITEKYITQTLIDKEYEKIKNEMNGWKSEYIPRLLGVIFHEFIIEEIWEILKEFKNPTINFKTLNSFVIQKIKELKKEIF